MSSLILTQLGLWSSRFVSIILPDCGQVTADYLHRIAQLPVEEGNGLFEILKLLASEELEDSTELSWNWRCASACVHLPLLPLCLSVSALVSQPLSLSVSALVSQCLSRCVSVSQSLSLSVSVIVSQCLGRCVSALVPQPLCLCASGSLDCK